MPIQGGGGVAPKPPATSTTTKNPARVWYFNGRSYYSYDSYLTAVEAEQHRQQAAAAVKKQAAAATKPKAPVRAAVYSPQAAAAAAAATQAAIAARDAANAQMREELARKKAAALKTAQMKALLIQQSIDRIKSAQFEEKQRLQDIQMKEHNRIRALHRKQAWADLQLQHSENIRQLQLKQRIAKRNAGIAISNNQIKAAKDYEFQLRENDVKSSIGGLQAGVDYTPGGGSRLVRRTGSHVAPILQQQRDAITKGEKTGDWRDAINLVDQLNKSTNGRYIPQRLMDEINNKYVIPINAIGQQFEAEGMKAMAAYDAGDYATYNEIISSKDFIALEKQFVEYFGDGYKIKGSFEGPAAILQSIADRRNRLWQAMFGGADQNSSDAEIQAAIDRVTALATTHRVSGRMEGVDTGVGTTDINRWIDGQRVQQAKAEADYKRQQDWMRGIAHNVLRTENKEDGSGLTTMMTKRGFTLVDANQKALIDELHSYIPGSDRRLLEIQNSPPARREGLIRDFMRDLTDAWDAANPKPAGIGLMAGASGAPGRTVYVAGAADPAEAARIQSQNIQYQSYYARRGNFLTRIFQFVKPNEDYNAFTEFSTTWAGSAVQGLFTVSALPLALTRLIRGGTRLQIGGQAEKNQGLFSAGVSDPNNAQESQTFLDALGSGDLGTLAEGIRTYGSGSIGGRLGWVLEGVVDPTNLLTLSPFMRAGAIAFAKLGGRVGIEALGDRAGVAFLKEYSRYLLLPRQRAIEVTKLALAKELKIPGHEAINWTSDEIVEMAEKAAKGQAALAESDAFKRLLESSGIDKEQLLSMVQAKLPGIAKEAGLVAIDPREMVRRFVLAREASARAVEAAKRATALARAEAKRSAALASLEKIGGTVTPTKVLTPASVAKHERLLTAFHEISQKYLEVATRANNLGMQLAEGVARHEPEVFQQIKVDFNKAIHELQTFEDQWMITKSGVKKLKNRGAVSRHFDDLANFRAKIGGDPTGPSYADLSWEIVNANQQLVKTKIRVTRALFQKAVVGTPEYEALKLRLKELYSANAGIDYQRQIIDGGRSLGRSITKTKGYAERIKFAIKPQRLAAVALNPRHVEVETGRGLWGKFHSVAAAREPRALSDTMKRRLKETLAELRDTRLPDIPVFDELHRMYGADVTMYEAWVATHAFMQTKVGFVEMKGIMGSLRTRVAEVAVGKGMRFGKSYHSTEEVLFDLAHDEHLYFGHTAPNMTGFIADDAVVAKALEGLRDFKAEGQVRNVERRFKGKGSAKRLAMGDTDPQVVLAKIRALAERGRTSFEYDELRWALSDAMLKENRAANLMDLARERLGIGKDVHLADLTDEKIKELRDEVINLRQRAAEEESARDFTEFVMRPENQGKTPDMLVREYEQRMMTRDKGVAPDLRASTFQLEAISKAFEERAGFAITADRRVARMLAGQETPLPKGMRFLDPYTDLPKHLIDDYITHFGDLPVHIIDDEAMAAKILDEDQLGGMALFRRFDDETDMDMKELDAFLNFMEPEDTIPEKGIDVWKGDPYSTMTSEDQMIMEINNPELKQPIAPRRSDRGASGAKSGPATRGPKAKPSIHKSYKAGQHIEVPKGRRIIISGTRDYSDRAFVEKVLDTSLKKYPDLVIIHGGAAGPEKWADAWAVRHGVPSVEILPNWEDARNVGARGGRNAAYQRNHEFFKINGGVDRIVGFPADTGRGKWGAVESVARLGDQNGVRTWIPDLTLRGRDEDTLYQAVLQRRARLEKILPELRRKAGQKFGLHVPAKWMDEMIRSIDEAMAIIQGSPLGVADSVAAKSTQERIKGIAKTRLEVAAEAEAKRLKEAQDAARKAGTKVPTKLEPLKPALDDLPVPQAQLRSVRPVLSIDGFSGTVGMAKLERLKQLFLGNPLELDSPGWRYFIDPKGVRREVSGGKLIEMAELRQLDEFLQATDMGDVGDLMKGTKKRKGFASQWIGDEDKNVIRVKDELATLNRELSDLRIARDEARKLTPEAAAAQRRARFEALLKAKSTADDSGMTLGATGVPEGVFLRPGASPKTIYHEAFHTLWLSAPNHDVVQRIRVALSRTKMSDHELMKRLHMGHTALDLGNETAKAEIAAELFALRRVGGKEWDTFYNGLDEIAQLGIDDTMSLWHDLKTAVRDQFGYGPLAPPLTNRMKMRDWLVENGFWSPRMREQIDSGELVWTIDEERAFYKQHFNYEPPWTDPAILAPLMDDHAALQAMMDEWGFFNSDFERLVATQDLEGRELHGAIAWGLKDANGNELISRGRTALEQRRWAIERFGKLVSKDGKTLDRMPWLMTPDEEYVGWLRKRLSATGKNERVAEWNAAKPHLSEQVRKAYFDDTGLKSVGIEVNPKLVTEKHLDRLNEAIVKATQRRLKRMKETGRAFDGDWMPQEQLQFAYDVTNELVADPYWRGMLRGKPIIGAGLELWGQFFRTLVSMTVAFPAMNLIDAYGFKRGFLTVFHNGFRPMSWDKEGARLVPNLRRIGAESASVFHLETDAFARFKDADLPMNLRLGSGIKSFTQLPITLSAMGEDALRLDFARSQAGRFYRNAIKQGMSVEAAESLARFEAKRMIHLFFATQGKQGWVRALNNLIPFFSYNANIAKFSLRTGLEHPALWAWAQRIDDAIVDANRKLWEERYPGVAFPDNPSSHWMWFKLGSDVYQVDLSVFSDWTRGLKSISSNQDAIDWFTNFVRIPHPSQSALIAAFTGGLTPWGKDPTAREFNGLVDFLFWLQGNDYSKPQDRRDLLQMGSQFFFFKKFGKLSPVTAQVQQWKFLKQFNPVAANDYLRAHPDLQAYFDSFPDKVRSIAGLVTGGEKTYVSWHDWMTPEQQATYYDANAGFFALQKKMDDRLAQYANKPWSEEYKQAKKEREIVLADYLYQHPVVGEVWGLWMSPSEFASLEDGYVLSSQMDAWFNWKKPEAKNFSTKLDYARALSKYYDDRTVYLEAHPALKDALYGGKTAIERAWHDQELHWAETLAMETKLKVTILEEQAKDGGGDSDLIDALYRGRDVLGLTLDTDRYANLWDYEDPAKGGGGFSLAIIPGFSRFIYDRASDAEKKVIDANNWYNRSIKEIVKSVRSGKEFYDRLLANPKLAAEYWKRNPDKKAQYDANQAYIGWIGRWARTLQANDFQTAQGIWDQMPEWVKQRYFLKHPDSKMRDGAGGGKGHGNAVQYKGQWFKTPDSRDRFIYFVEQGGKGPVPAGLDLSKPPSFHSAASRQRFERGQQYFASISKWVEMLQAKQYGPADKYFNALPTWMKDKYYAKHPDQRAQHELGNAMLVHGADYFLATGADKLKILERYPEFAAWLKKYGGDEAAQRGLVMAIYRAIPTTEPWLKRTFRLKFPEVFSQEAAGAARIAGVERKLAENPDMEPFYWKALALQQRLFIEQLKLSKTLPKPWTMERVSRLKKRKKRRAARFSSEWSMHANLRHNRA